MKALFDTHALLWAVLKPRILSASALQAVQNPSNELFVSAASAWEIATKVRLRKLPEAEIFEREFLSDIDRAGYTLLAIETEVALRAGRLPGSHDDPFDRMIAAQALSQDMIVLSNDTKLDSFGVRRLW